jgi:hypothetical protein
MDLTVLLIHLLQQEEEKQALVLLEVLADLVVAVVGADLLDMVIHGVAVVELLDKEIMVVKDSMALVVAVAVEKVLLDKIEVQVA